MKDNRQLPSLVLLKEPNPMEKFFSPPDENLKKALATFNVPITALGKEGIKFSQDLKILPHENRHK